MIHSRQDLQHAKRIVIKAGTSVVSTPEGFPSLLRMANIVEYASRLVRQGKEVLIVTSGAVGVGRQRLRRQALLRQSLVDHMSQKDPTHTLPEESRKSYNSACAAAGQLGLMSLYETMFNQFDVSTSQLLVTSFDFTSPERRANVQDVISQLLNLGIVPLLNENDAVVAMTYGMSFSDNDSLAALVAVEMSAQLLILLTDVKGVYDLPPSDPHAQLIDVFRAASADFKEGDKSSQGRGGMSAKVGAALSAITGGVQAVVIAAGGETGIIDSIMQGRQTGTLFLHSEVRSADAPPLSAIGEEKSTPEDMARMAREGARQLQALSSVEREDLLRAIADAIAAKETDILAMNAIDVKNAETALVDCLLDIQVVSRLKLTHEKLATLVEGIRAIADQTEPIGQLLLRTELAEGLVLEKSSCPIGVLLIIFESRPDCLPQIAALAIRSGNGLLLKGGKEAEHSNAFLHKVIADTIERVAKGKVSRHAIGLVTSRADIASLLRLDQYIDLVIPRGSGALVKFIKDNTRIPVMGHAEGVCHVYVDAAADVDKAVRVVVDAKTDYPSACNAAETLLLHEDLVASGEADKIMRALRVAGVSLYGGPHAVWAGCTDQAAKDMRTEYGGLAMTVEVVSSLRDAVDHINAHGRWCPSNPYRHR